MSKNSSVTKTRNLVLTAIFAALIIVMTVTPFLGYISYGSIEITTLHIVTILGAVCLGPKSGTVIGTVWGLSCLARAYFVFPIYLDFGFGNFFVAALPRILVGLFSGDVFFALKKTKVPKPVSAVIATVIGTLTNTVLVLSSMNLWAKFNGKDYSDVFTVIGNIFQTLIGINGIIELVAAVVIVPVIYSAVFKSYSK